jgi:hypothetical protein
MQHVEIEEVRERASELLTGSEALTVEHQGHVVGVYLPLPQPDQQGGQDSLAALRAAIAAALSNGQLTVDELADLFDLRRPVA